MSTAQHEPTATESAPSFVLPPVLVASTNDRKGATAAGPGRPTKVGLGVDLRRSPSSQRFHPALTKSHAHLRAFVARWCMGPRQRWGVLGQRRSRRLGCTALLRLVLSRQLPSPGYGRSSGSSRQPVKAVGKLKYRFSCGSIGELARDLPRFAESAVEPTRSQNITVSCRRSASLVGGETGVDVALAGGWTKPARRLRPQGGDRGQQLTAKDLRSFLKFWWPITVAGSSDA
jgi:hypothetical protein